MYVVCVPSYRRAEVCNRLTLAQLAAHGIDPARIFVYVADEQEREVYEAALDRQRYGSLVVAAPGIIAVREFIIDSWPEGTNIVSVDDDIRRIVFRTEYKDLHSFFCEAFEECRRRGAYIWGVHPIGTNALFMQAGPDVSTDLRYIVGALDGFVNRPALQAIRWDISRQCDNAKDDVELSILYFVHDGAVVRFNRVGIYTRYFSSGGMGKAEQRRASHEAAAKRLAERYPGFGHLREKRNGILDFVIRPRRAPARSPGSPRRRCAPG